MKCAYCGGEIYQGLRLEIQMEKWPEFYSKVTKWYHDDCKKLNQPWTIRCTK